MKSQAGSWSLVSEVSQQAPPCPTARRSGASVADLGSARWSAPHTEPDSEGWMAADSDRPPAGIRLGAHLSDRFAVSHPSPGRMQRRQTVGKGAELVLTQASVSRGSTG